MVQRFLLAVRKKSGVVNAVVVISVAKALVKRSGKRELEVIDLDSRWWIQSLFRQMHFGRRTATISKVEIPKGAKKKRSQVYFFSHSSSLQMDTLPFQLIYGGKTTRSLPKFKFPKEFSLSINENHLSNTQESLKIFREIVIPYVNH